MERRYLTVIITKKNPSRKDIDKVSEILFGKIGEGKSEHTQKLGPNGEVYFYFQGVLGEREATLKQLGIVKITEGLNPPKKMAIAV